MPKNILTLVCLAVVVLIASCGGKDASGPPPAGTPATVTISAGDQQQALPGQSVAIAPAVLVLDADQKPLAGVRVEFSIAAGGGSLQGAEPLTDAAGVARLGRWTLGQSGEQRLSARVGALPPVGFRATLSPPTGPDQVEATFGPGGGSFEITTTGHPYRGLALTVPAGTFAGSQAIRFRVLPQANLPALPSGYRKSGPVLGVTSSQLRGSGLMTLRVPISHGANEQTVLAFHDPVRRITEILPAVYRDDTLLVAVTSHLRADLLNGPGMGSLLQDEPEGWLMPVSVPVPMPTVSSVLSDLDVRWPVLDYGSAQRPGGFGPAIPVLQSVAAATGQTLTWLSRALDTPGLHSDLAQLATVSRVAQTSTSALGQAITKYTTAESAAIQQLGKSFGKELTDQLANHTITASLALSRKPLPVVLGRGSQVDAAVATAVAGTNNTVGLLLSSVQSLASFTREAASGFQDLNVPPAGGQAPVPVNRAIPISSFLFDFKEVAGSLEDLARVTAMAAGSAARSVAAQQLAAAAGVPAVTLEVESVPGGGFSRLADETLVVRSDDVQLRVPTVGGSTGFLVHLASSGALEGETTGTTISIDEIPGVNGAAELVPIDVIISPIVKLAGAVQQVSVSLIRIIKAPFEVTPTDATLSEPLQKITFTATVPHPPAGGYAIDWDWGNGHFAIHQNTPTATIEFIEVKDYKVVATLLDLTGSSARPIAADTVDVVVDQFRTWRLESFVDQDALFSDPDINPGNSSIVSHLQRILAEPNSTLLTVEQQSVNSSELLFKTLMSHTWDPDQCCPPNPPANPWRMALGRDPEESYPLGPYFAAWNSSYWKETTTDLGSGTMTGQQVVATDDYKIDGQVQEGPAGAFRVAATRSGKSMTGTLSLYIWWVDDEGELEGPPEEFRFPFVATRIR